MRSPYPLQSDKSSAEYRRTLFTAVAPTGRAFLKIADPRNLQRRLFAPKHCTHASGPYAEAGVAPCKGAGCGGPPRRFPATGRFGV